MVDRYTFADSETGLTLALHTTLAQRRFGFTTRLVTVPIKLGTGFTGVMYTVVCVPPARPNREGQRTNKRTDEPHEQTTAHHSQQQPHR